MKRQLATKIRAWTNRVSLPEYHSKPITAERDRLLLEKKQQKILEKGFLL